MININKYKNYRKIQNGGSDDTIIFDNDSINMKELNIDELKVFKNNLTYYRTLYINKESPYKYRTDKIMINNILKDSVNNHIWLPIERLLNSDFLLKFYEFDKLQFLILIHINPNILICSDFDYNIDYIQKKELLIFILHDNITNFIKFPEIVKNNYNFLVDFYIKYRKQFLKLIILYDIFENIDFNVVIKNKNFIPEIFFNDIYFNNNKTYIYIPDYYKNKIQILNKYCKETPIFFLDKLLNNSTDFITFLYKYNKIIKYVTKDLLKDSIFKKLLNIFFLKIAEYSINYLFYLIIQNNNIIDYYDIPENMYTIFLNILLENSLVFKNFPKSIQKNSKFLFYIYKNNIELFITLININYSIIQYIKFHNDEQQKKFFKDIFKYNNNIYRFLSSKLSNKDFLIELLNTSYNKNTYPEKYNTILLYYNNKSINDIPIDLLNLLRKDEDTFIFLPNEYKNNIKIVYKCFKENPFIFLYIPELIKEQYPYIKLYIPNLEKYILLNNKE